MLHSIVASVLVDCAFIAWNIGTPCLKQRFRFLVILLPVVSFPLYQALYPRRGDAYFRLESLLDSNKWFSLELWHGVPLFMGFVVILALSALIFIIQEFLPMFLHMREQMREASEPLDDAVEQVLAQKVSQALEGLPFDEQFVEIVVDEDLSLFSDTGLNPRIYVSTGLIKTLTIEQLQAAFAHEIGHIQRTRRPVLIFAYILRVLMFYNPIAMLEFRKLAQEEEKVCDDIAISLTGNPAALSSAVEMFRPDPEDLIQSPDAKKTGGIASTIEHYNHDLLLKSRILSIGEPRQDDCHWGASYFVTLAIIVVINFFIV
ncbi:MAG: M48 family metalloprotease [Nitrospirae bacterium]|nr:M48 family metalloprotease [Nitrospirota bacterium]